MRALAWLGSTARELICRIGLKTTLKHKRIKSSYKVHIVAIQRKLRIFHISTVKILGTGNTVFSSTHI